MPGTLLRDDWQAVVERNNASELNDHLQSLLTPDATQVPPAPPEPAPAPLTPPQELRDHLTSLLTPDVTQAPPVQATPEPQEPPQELQAHLDSLLTPAASQAPPVTPAPVPEPAPAPANVVGELASHVRDLGGGPLNLIGEGLTSLGAGARQAGQTLGQGLTSLQAPSALPRSTVSEPAPGPSVPPGGGPGAGGPFQDYARQAAARVGIDPDIFVRQIQQESGFNPKAFSPAGAAGIAQIVPRYHPGVDPSDPYASLDYAANLMRSHLGRYGGDYSKALAAYNAGPGAVERYGGVPPFEETQRYVSTILGGGQPRGAAPTPAEGVARAGGALSQANRDVSQFGDSQLTADEATAACGPAAAVRFAQRFGRNPSLREATDLAKTVGWTSAQGMAGLSSEKALMDKMGVATKLVSGADWGAFANEARTGNPVTISTQGHYFTADGWDPNSNRFHVGRSGLDLRGGSEWMTPEQMTGIMGPVQGGLLADNPTVPASTIGKTAGFTAPTSDQQAAQAEAPKPLQFLGEGFSALGSAAQGGLKVIDDAVNAIARPQTAAVPGQGYDPSSMRAVTEPPQEGIPLKQDVRDLGLPSQPTIFQDPTRIPGILRGPAPTTDQELLDRAGPQGIAAARQLAQVSQIGPKREPTDAEIAEVLRGTSLGEAYAGTHGVEPGAAQASTAGAEAEVARLRLDKFPDWLQPTIEDAARATDFGAAQRRGVIPDVQAETMADELGRSVDDWIKQSQVGRSLNTEETRALRNVITTQAQTVQDLAEQVTTAAGRGEATDQLIAKAAIEGNKLEDLTTMMEGARAEWGRAGRAWQASTRLIELPPNEAISEIYKTLGGRDNALAAVQELNALQQSGATPIQLAQFWGKIKNPEAGFQDWVKALRYNSMLSGPRTIEVNAIGNSLEIPWRLARDTGASLIRGRPEELAPEAAGLVAGFDKGRRAFMETLTHGMTTEQALAGEIPHSLADRVRNPALKPVARALDVPSRVLAAGDSWGKAMAQSMALGRRAGVTASKEGLSGPAWNERVAELLANPTSDMLKEADAISERMVYHGDMGTLGSAFEQFQRVPFLGNAVLPFLRTVYHIQARGFERSPIGLAQTAMELGKGTYGPRTLANLREQLGASVGPSKGVPPLGERLSDNLVGSAATLAFFQQAQAGNVTGAGPDDPEKRDMLRAQGWQPYSVKIGDHYVSYANWGPVATALAEAAGAAEAIQYRKENAANVPTILVDAGRRTAKLITEQSYLQGIGTIWKALDQPDRYSAQVLGQMMTSLVPYGSAVNTLGQAMDPVQRQVGKVRDVGLPAYLQQSVEARLPGVREELPPALDQLGRPIPNEATGAGALNPLRTTTIRSNAVLQELLANGADVGEPPTSVRNVDLTPAEQRTVNEKAGQYIERNVQAVMADPDYQRADGLGKQRALQRAVERARTQAGGELLQGLTDAEIKRRLEEGRTKREPVPIGLSGG